MSTCNSPVDNTLTTEEEPKTLREALCLLRDDAKAKGVDKLTMEENH